MTLQETPTLSKNSTVYSYTLMKRIYHSTYKLIFYFLPLAAILLYQFKSMNWLPLISGYPLVMILHALLVRIYFQFTIGMAMRGWSFRWGIFWCGFLPEGHASIRLVSKVQLHLLWIGLACITALYPWIPGDWLLHLYIFHIWLLAPRLWMLFRFRRFRKNGLIKISFIETSCYTQ